MSKTQKLMKLSPFSALIIAFGLIIVTYFVTKSFNSQPSKSMTELSIPSPTSIPTYEPTPIPTPDLNSILLNYKIDVADGKDEMDTMLTSVTNTPYGICPAIIASSSTRDNIYYLYVDFLSNIETKYGKYRNAIPYIDTNLGSLYGAVQLVKDKCASIGYTIE